LQLVATLYTFLLTLAIASDWPMFRGPNGAGLSVDKGLPVEFGPQKNLAWKVPLGIGHSSPVIVGERIYITALEQDRLFTLCLRKSDGKELWRRECPRPRKDVFDKRNNAASPSPAADEKNVYVFFPEFGMLSYTRDGAERWKLPLGPFDNFYGMGASPILAGDLVVLACDQKRGSFILAAGKNDGKVKWKRDRKEAVSGHSTPVLYQPKNGPLQVIAPGSFRMEAYQASTGELLWHQDGLASEMKSVAVVVGDTIYINGYNLPENDPGKQVAIPPFAEMLANDRNKDGGLAKDEMPDGRAKSFFDYLDLDHNAKLDADEWRFFQQGMQAENSLLAVKGGGGTVWKYHKSIPQLPSVVVYEKLLYMVNDTGILAVLDPSDGREVWRGRLRTVSDRVYSSPVAADGKIYFATQSGAVVVRKAGAEHTVLAVNELGEECYATPAISDGRVYVRTTQALYAFGAR
jgi:outer membrane protein assembly factor BamB